MVDTDSTSYQRNMIDSGLMDALFTALQNFKDQDIVLSKLARFLILIFEDGTAETQVQIIKSIVKIFISDLDDFFYGMSGKMPQGREKLNCHCVRVSIIVAKILERNQPLAK